MHREAAARSRTLRLLFYCVRGPAAARDGDGALIAGLRMVPFIVTLGSLGIVRGTTKWLANNQAVYYPTARQKAANPDTESS